MPRRTVQAVDPLSAQSRTLALTLKGGAALSTLRNEFEIDKALKDSKIATLEADKTTQDGKLSTLEADKNNKDTQMTALDTRVTTMEDSATGIVDGGRADVQHLEATDINGGSASI